MTNSYCVIMCGGVGSRFWPMSTPAHPKQFQDVLGSGTTLLQQTYHRAIKITPPDRILVVTNKQYVDKVATQIDIPKENILAEPIMRNTAPCIAYAAFKIYRRDPRSNMLVFPADHYIGSDEKFAEEMKQALSYASQQDVLITFGVCPHYPSQGYGYIQKGKKQKNDFYEVVRFTEKPSLALAKEFLLQGNYLWNSGIFAWSTQYILHELKAYLPALYDLMSLGLSKMDSSEEQSFMDENFHHCPNISIDYGIMEQSPRIRVKEVKFSWSDIGTWNAVYDILPKSVSDNVAGKTTNFYQSSKNIIRLSSQKKIAIVQGLHDFIVVETPESLLICKRDQEQEVKKFLSDIHSEN